MKFKESNELDDLSKINECLKKYETISDIIDTINKFDFVKKVNTIYDGGADYLFLDIIFKSTNVLQICIEHNIIRFITFSGL